MKNLNIISNSEVETINLGKKISKLLKVKDIVCLFGELGSGKTVFVKGLSKGLGINGFSVNSPTFVLMNVYDGKKYLYHFDLYRLENKEDINSIDCVDYLYGDGISVIEWADRLGELMPEEYLKIQFLHKNDTQRKIKIYGMGNRYQEVVNNIRKNIV